MKNFFLGLSIILVFFGGFADVRSQQGRPNDQVRPVGILEANNKATNWFDKTFRKCEIKGKPNYYTKIDILNGYFPRQITIIEIEKLKKEPIQWQVEKLENKNGLEARWIQVITGEFFRSFPAQDAKWGVYSKNFRLALKLTKRKDADWVLESERPEYSAPTCEEVKSFYDGSYLTRLRDEGRKRLTNIIRDFIDYKFPQCTGNEMRYVLIHKQEGDTPINYGVLQLKPVAGKDFFEPQITDKEVDVFAGISPLIETLESERTLKIPIKLNIAGYEPIVTFNNSKITLAQQVGNPLKLDSIYFRYVPGEKHRVVESQPVNSWYWVLQLLAPDKKVAKSIGKYFYTDDVIENYDIFTESVKDRLYDSDSFIVKGLSVNYDVKKLDSKSHTCGYAKAVF